MTARKATPTLDGGDARVVAHPGFREIPGCLFPLKSEAAQKEYETLARMLFNAGRLTAAKHRELCTYAMQFDVVTTYPAEGKMLKAATFTQLEKSLKALKLDDIDQPVAAPESAKANKFAVNGFPARRQRHL